eukprot:4654857-Alexandrium_andersonii.AAC.1
MSASLVGSEMCIRDSCVFASLLVCVVARLLGRMVAWLRRCAAARLCCCAVSYTHLTLPTICSV